MSSGKDFAEYAGKILEYIQFGELNSSNFYADYRQGRMSEDDYLSEAKKIGAEWLRQIYIISGIFYEKGDVEQAKHYFNQAEEYDKKMSLNNHLQEVKTLVAELLHKNMEGINDLLRKDSLLE